MQTEKTPVSLPAEKILFEIKPLMLPTILNMENLTVIGFVALAVMAYIAFPGHIGLPELIILGALFLLFAVPSFRSIFLVGGTTYVLTNQRVVIFSPGFGTKEKSIPLDQIQSVKCKSSGLQRFYGAGEIRIQQKGRLGITRLQGLIECKRRAEQIQSAVQKFKSASGR